jgi:hypothetical protein
MLTFLETLLQTGQPTLNPGESKPNEWIDRQLSTTPPKVTEKLRNLHTEQSLTFPGPPLAFDEGAAWFGFRTLFILVSATGFRELEFMEIEAWLKRVSLPLETPSAHFSSDLCLQHLPAIRELIIRIADGDPLLQLVDILGLQTPLSSVGLTLKESPNLNVINQHPGLAQFHAERVVRLSDRTRAAAPLVSKIIQAMAGAHRDKIIPRTLHSLL